MKQRIIFALVGLLVAASAHSAKVGVGDTSGLSFEAIYLELEKQSPNTRRRAVSALGGTLEAPVDLEVFTRLRRVKSNGREAYSNATLIAGGNCYWIASAAGHSVLDQRFSRLANRGAISVELPSGDWVNPVEVITRPELNWNSDEMDDWALLVLRAPRCAFDDSQQFSDALPHLPTTPVNAKQIRACQKQVQMMCFHFDQGVATGQRMIEENCQLLSIVREEGSTGYTSCKVDYGVSGCSPVCVQGDLWLNLGVFSKGLKRHRVETYPQLVAAFRFVDGEFAEALERLKQKYHIAE